MLLIIANLSLNACCLANGFSISNHPITLIHLKANHTFSQIGNKLHKLVKWNSHVDIYEAKTIRKYFNLSNITDYR